MHDDTRFLDEYWVALVTRDRERTEQLRHTAKEDHSLSSLLRLLEELHVIQLELAEGKPKRKQTKRD